MKQKCFQITTKRVALVASLTVVLVVVVVVVVVVIIIMIIHEFHRDASLEQNFRAVVCQVLH